MAAATKGAARDNRGRLRASPAARRATIPAVSDSSGRQTRQSRTFSTPADTGPDRAQTPTPRTRSAPCRFSQNPAFRASFSTMRMIVHPRAPNPAKSFRPSRNDLASSSRPARRNAIAYWFW